MTIDGTAQLFRFDGCFLLDTFSSELSFYSNYLKVSGFSCLISLLLASPLNNVYVVCFGYPRFPGSFEGLFGSPLDSVELLVYDKLRDVALLSGGMSRALHLCFCMEAHC